MSAKEELSAEVGELMINEKNTTWKSGKLELRVPVGHLVSPTSISLIHGSSSSSSVDNDKNRHTDNDLL